MFDRRFIPVFLSFTVLLGSLNSVYAATYQLNVNAVCKVQTTVVPCVPPYPGSAVNSSGQITAGSSIHLAVTSPSYSGSPPGVRWSLDGYLLWKDGVSQTPQPVNSNAFDLVIDTSYNVTWQWHEEVNLTLTSNYGTPTLIGGGWVPAGGSTSISAPNIFFNGNSQYLFSKWVALSGGNVTFTNANAPSTTVTISSVPVLEADYALVSSNMTNTFTTTITTIIGSSTVTTTSTGIFSHGNVNVQLQIRDSQMTPSLLANANVTVLDDAGVKVFQGLTDQSGLTQQFPVKTTLIYMIQINYLGHAYTAHQQFPASGSYPVDIAAAQPLISTQTLGQLVIPIIVVFIVVVALAVYLASRRGPQKPHVEWVSR